MKPALWKLAGIRSLPVRGKDGKLSAEEIRQAVLSHPDCHMVKPALVYLSQPTELGTLYTLSELKAIPRGL